MKKLLTYIFFVAILIAGCEHAVKKKEEPVAMDKDTLTSTKNTVATIDSLDIPKEQEKLLTEEIEYKSDSINLKGYLVYNNNDTLRRPGVLIIHEWWGYNDYVRRRAEELAELGYVTFALDMYGNGKEAKHPGDAKKLAMNVMTNLPLARKRFEAALEELKKQPYVDTTKIGVVGYSFGGSVALTMANAGENLKAVAVFHSGLELPVMPGKDLKASILICNGALDSLVSKESVTIYKKKLKNAKADYKYISYKEAKHSFTNSASDSIGEKFDLPMEYNAEADQKSWEELITFFTNKLKK